jgi:CheY-like chemotaxis protein
MDHMMPGMDGFQAVQTIKNNPRTSSIPILMYTSQEGDLYLGQARALGAEGVLPKQIKHTDVTKMLYQLRLVSDRRTREQTTFRSMDPGTDLVPANESAIVIVAPPPAAAITVEGAAPAAAEPAPQFLSMLPQMSLEIRAALDNSLQKEIAALRNFIGSTLDTHTERLQGDLSALLPATRTPDLDLPTVMPERRPWGAISGWTLALLAVAGGAVMSWMWWNQGVQLAALRTDLAAAYTELETLRARPEVVSAPAPVVNDPAAVLPAADALQEALPGTETVALVPTGAAITPPAAIMAVAAVADTPVVVEAAGPDELASLDPASSVPASIPAAAPVASPMPQAQ